MRWMSTSEAGGRQPLGYLWANASERAVSRAVATALLAVVLLLPTDGACAVRVARVHRHVSASRLCRGVSRVRPTVRCRSTWAAGTVRYNMPQHTCTGEDRTRVSLVKPFSQFR